MKVHLSILLLILSQFFIDCKRQTRLFKNIEVRGRLVNFFTKEPVPNTEIKLRANDVHSSSSYSTARIELASAVTDNDGNFILKSKASKKDNYQLEIVGANRTYAYSLVDTFFTAKPKSVYNIGDINTGDHQYWYRVRYRPTSGSCAWVPDANLNTIRLRVGLDTAILYNFRISYFNLKESNRTLFVSFRNGSCDSEQSGLFQRREFQITNADTMRFEVDF